MFLNVCLHRGDFVRGDFVQGDYVLDSCHCPQYRVHGKVPGQGFSDPGRSPPEAKSILILKLSIKPFRFYVLHIFFSNNYSICNSYKKICFAHVSVGLCLSVINYRIVKIVITHSGLLRKIYQYCTKQFPLLPSPVPHGRIQNLDLGLGVRSSA